MEVEEKIAKLEQALNELKRDVDRLRQFIAARTRRDEAEYSMGGLGDGLF